MNRSEFPVNHGRPVRRPDSRPGMLLQVACVIMLFLVIVCSVAIRGASANDSRVDDRRPVYRSPDRRPHHDDPRLKSQGFAVFESKRLKLYTDVEDATEKVPAILRAADALYDALCEYFGPLPPSPERTEFQVTGYLMADKERFRQAGLLPANLPAFANGRHRGQQLWVNEQDADYYCRHLVLHEFSHCFMFLFPGVDIPNWYAEGMAELFGTHRVDEHGRYHFRVMPDRIGNFDGLGRIPLVREDLARRGRKALSDPESITPKDFFNQWSNTSYAWCWARCAFLDGHPRYSARFRELGKHTTNGEFDEAFRRLFGPDLQHLSTEWLLFSHQLQPGYDLVRSAIDFREGAPLRSPEDAHATAVDSGRGWQSSGVEVRSGRNYEIVAAGEISLANDPKPWISQPQGISILYSEKHPIGALLATVHGKSTDRASRTSPDESMLNDTVVGRGMTFTPAVTGTLYLRINDFWDSLANNKGQYKVIVRELAAAKR